MEVFTRMDNSLIKKIDSISIDHEIKKPMKNSLKTFVKLGTSKTFTSGDTYNKKVTIEIGRSYDNLSMLFIKSYMSNGRVADVVEPLLGTRIFKKIRLSTRRGTNLQTLVPEYLQARIAELKGSQIYEKIADSVEPSGDFVDSDPTAITPLFLFCSEDETTMLNTRNYENLVLELETNDDEFLLGMSTPLTFIYFEVYGLFFDTDTSSSITDHLNTKKTGLTRQIVGSYNIFFEDNVNIVNGQTSAKLLLRCPHPTFAIHGVIQNDVTASIEITRVKMSFGNRVFLDLDYTMNYQFFGKQQGYLESTAFSYFFSKMKERNIDSGLITFSKEMSPCIIEYFFVSNGDYTIKTLCEYRTNFKVDETGFVSLSNDVLMGEGQNQTNSVGFFS